MSLRLKLQMLIAALMFLMVLALGWREIEGTRRSVREEVQTAQHIALQLLKGLDSRPLTEAQGILEGLGRVRASQITLLDDAGRMRYASPESNYKKGRDAPAWFSALVGPPASKMTVPLNGGTLHLQSDASRAILDGWDDLTSMVLSMGLGLVLISTLAGWLVHRALAPLIVVEQGLRDMQYGRFETRLPCLRGREGRLMSQAFNEMAQGVQATLKARDEARQAQQSLAHARELAQVVEARLEAERSRLARELHDEMGQQLTAIRSLCQVMLLPARKQDAALSDPARMISDIAAQMYDAMHQLMPRLRPPALDQLGLGAALTELIGDWQRQRPDMAFKLQLRLPEGKVGDTLGTAVYRIVQEAVTNAVKHALAGHVQVSLDLQDAFLVLAVEDDGRGLPADWQRPGHYGLIGMKERVQTLGGRLEFGAGLKAGVRLRVWLPLTGTGMPT